ALAARAKTSENEAASRLNERADMNRVPSDDARERTPAIMAESIALATAPFSFAGDISPTSLTFPAAASCRAERLLRKVRRGMAVLTLHGQAPLGGRAPRASSDHGPHHICIWTNCPS